MNTTSRCSQCPKSFTHPTEASAQHALRMHVARKHRLSSSNGHSGMLRQRRGGALIAVGSDRSHLTAKEADALASYIRENKSKFISRQLCFGAALKATGLDRKIKNSSTAVTRYFKRAEVAAPPTGEKPKRQYTKRKQVAAHQHVHVNFCPNCGCNIHAVATGMAMAGVK